MKYYILLLFSILLISTQAQDLTKEEKKALIKEIKQLKKSPEKYKFLKESSSAKDEIINAQNNAMGVLEKEKRIITAENKTISDSISILTKSIEEYKRKGDCKLINEGYKYRVQIGLYKNLDLTNLLAQPKFMVHEIAGGLNRYSIGNFNDLNEALQFKEEMKRLGIKDAFVTEYEEGDRVNYNNSANNKKKYEQVSLPSINSSSSSISTSPIKVSNSLNSSSVNVKASIKTPNSVNESENTSTKEIEEVPIPKPTNAIISSPFYGNEEEEEIKVTVPSSNIKTEVKETVKTINTSPNEVKNDPPLVKEEVGTPVKTKPLDVRKDAPIPTKLDVETPSQTVKEEKVIEVPVQPDYPSIPSKKNQFKEVEEPSSVETESPIKTTNENIKITIGPRKTTPTKTIETSEGELEEQAPVQNPRIMIKLGQ